VSLAALPPGALRALRLAPLALGAALGLAPPAPAAPAGPARDVVLEVREWRRGHEARVLRELLELLEIPNVASDADGIRRNAEALRAMLERRGVSAELLTAEPGPPAVFGERRAPGATRTLVFYAHYDGQPADPADWTTPPWAPVLRDGPLPGSRLLETSALDGEIDPGWRVFGRSASDDKSPIVAALAALDALDAASVPLSVNLKFFLEGEEEAGSPHLEAMLARHRERLGADVWLFADGPVHQSGRPQVVYGVRGSMGVEITSYGALRPLHSGHYGNWAPNPIAVLAEVLAGLRDSEGRIRIEGFYDDVEPPSELALEALAAYPDPDAQLVHELALGRTENEGRSLIESLLLPAVNLRGVRAAQVGEDARNAIPPEARASVGFRLVPGQTTARVREQVEAHLERQGYGLVHAEPDAETRRSHRRLLRLDWSDGYAAMGTPLDLPVARAIPAVLDEALDEPVVRVPLLGGSLPLVRFQEALGAPLVIVPMVNHDNNQHAADENLRIGNLWRGIEMYAALFARLGHAEELRR
jgi:acetylornithine deacetylase/succinyl-diaminopimelate desuccinylase-like protein